MEGTNPDDSRRLEGQFCFALYSATHAVMRSYRPLLEPLGLTYPQYLVLLVLWEQGEQTVGGVADRMFLDPSTLTPLLKRLEGMGLVRRMRNPDNERQLIVSLTEAGRALQDQARDIPAALLCASARPIDELLRLRDELVAIRESFAAAGAA
ncbi:MarR family transcriptional regulator [Ancylobacter dichloromethanicus]|uniref:HTH marR-type domain-containing protein n=1 Tax=Ancylobacter dichloromethanicus TaxID=518825 RepID=A0A9W6JBE4_9HYPH|nr:MarR family transcriptional regulator [Ancylobacter dichloromethanicus]MBS7555106.1 MarR family transcriptional regulator [Ancylobacter dichloromethanicus]GLK74445.1 hypothetical protein GCM10017643_45630 [Ancylobacter dichloromethanicus]